MWSKNSCLGPYQRMRLNQPLPGLVLSQFLLPAGGLGPMWKVTEPSGLNSRSFMEFSDG
jgi:hypothetical protein